MSSSDPRAVGGPAVIYFAKAPVSGLVKTRLCPPLTLDEAAGLYGAFLRQAVVPVPGATNFVYGWPEDRLADLRDALPILREDAGITLRLQAGEDLWARMTACFAECFTQGFGPVLLRNTDSPELELEIVTRALALAVPGRVVLGPDCGGGYYLIALAAPCPELFEGVAEGADTVLTATVGKAEALGLEVELLPERADVDTFEDLTSMWRARDRSDPIDGTV